MAARRRNPAKSIVYPLFEEFASVSTDPYWREFFHDCARGNMPAGISVNGRVLTHAKLFEQRHYRLSADPRVAKEEVTRIFTRYLGIGPARDSSQSRSTTQREHKGWKSLKRKHMKTALLERFIERLQEIYQLNREQVEELTYVLWLASLSDLLNGDTIEMQDGIVTSISSIEFDGKNFFLRSDMIPDRPPLRLAQPPDPLFKDYSQPMNLRKIYNDQMTKIARRIDNSKVRSLAGHEEEDKPDG